MVKAIKGRLLLGTQGFSFPDWVGPFYPTGTKRGAYLEEYARRFPIVEIDSTFYGIPRLTTIQGWRERTPEDFKFAAKFPKLITHEKKLDRALGDAEAFVGALQALSDKLAVLILQFSYDFTPDNFERLDDFLGALPEGPRYAVEVRNRAWLTSNLRDMLSNHNAAFVLQDLPYMPKLDWVTADFTVIRWLGQRKDVMVFDRIQIDRTQDLEVWAKLVKRFIEDGIDVYGFFNNHYAGHSPASVQQFAAIVGLDMREVDDGGETVVQQLELEVGDDKD